ncbi:hypothetical protein D3C78_1338350 [compost metagenome]
MLILDHPTGTKQCRFEVFFVILFQARDLFGAGATTHFQMVDQDIIAQVGQIALKTGFLCQLLQKRDQVKIWIFLPGRL